MTSRDGYNRNRPTRGSTPAPQGSQRQGAGWELDADELDRYMSGQPAREPRFDPYGRPQSSGRTTGRPAPQPHQQQPPDPQYDDYAPQAYQPEGEWQDDDYGYEGEYGYEEYEPDPEPARQRPQQTRRQPRQPEPDYGDDLYDDDPYVIDEEEAPRRPRRRSQKTAARSRQPRQAPEFSLPPMIAEAPLVKDSKAVIMLGAALLSVLVMVIVVITRRDGLDAVIFTHVNANGDPQNLQDASAIWNLPLIAGMVTLISAVLAWFLARWDTFLPRFLLGGAIGVQFVVWVAIYAYLF